MKENLYYRIGWSDIDRRNYLYGTNVRMLSDGTVRCENAMMPPGTALTQWISMETARFGRREPRLPILVNDSTYTVKPYALSDTPQTVLFQLHAYDRMNRELAVYTFDAEGLTFTAPDEMLWYQIDLVNAGFQWVEFHALILYPGAEADFPFGRLLQPDVSWSNADIRQEASGFDIEKSSTYTSKSASGSNIANQNLQVLTVFLPPEQGGIVRFPEENVLRDMQNVVIAPPEFFMVGKLFSDEWLRKLMNGSDKNVEADNYTVKKRSLREQWKQNRAEKQDFFESIEHLIFQDEVLVENVAVSKDSSTSKTAVESRHERLRIISLSEGNRELAERLRRKYPGCDVLQFDSSESFFEWKRDQGFI